MRLAPLAGARSLPAERAWLIAGSKRINGWRCVCPINCNFF